MKLTSENIKNPYLAAYARKNNIKTGEDFPIVNYMFWIDEKHDLFRKKNGLPEFIDLNEKQQEKFIEFINA